MATLELQPLAAFQFSKPEECDIDSPVDFLRLQKSTKSVALCTVWAKMLRTYVTVFWKTDRIDTNTDIHFLPVDESHTHALFRDTKHLRLDGRVCFYRRLFSDVKP